MKDHRADGFIGGHLLGGVDQSFEHRLVERVVLAGAHHRHIGYAAGADLNTNPVIGHPKQSTAGFRSALDYPSGTPPGGRRLRGLELVEAKRASSSRYQCCGTSMSETSTRTPVAASRAMAPSVNKAKVLELSFSFSFSSSRLSAEPFDP